MNRNFALAVAAYVVVVFALAALWHLVLFKSVYDELGIFTRDEPLIHLGVLWMFVQALVVAYMYPRYRRGGGIIKEGLSFGVLLGLFMGSSAVLAEAGKQEVSNLRQWLALEGSYYLLQFAIVGIVVAWVYDANASVAKEPVAAGQPSV